MIPSNKAGGGGPPGAMQPQPGPPHPGGPGGPMPPHPPMAVASDAQAKEKLKVYVYEYLKHTGANQTAESFLQEIDWSTKNISLGDAPGFLLSWWCVFWDLYSAAPERRDHFESSQEAKLFHDQGFVNSGFSNHQLPNGMHPANPGTMKPEMMSPVPPPQYMTPVRQSPGPSPHPPGGMISGPGGPGGYGIGSPNHVVRGQMMPGGARPGMPGGPGGAGMPPQPGAGVPGPPHQQPPPRPGSGGEMMYQQPGGHPGALPPGHPGHPYHPGHPGHPHHLPPYQQHAAMMSAQQRLPPTSGAAQVPRMPPTSSFGPRGGPMPVSSAGQMPPGARPPWHQTPQGMVQMPPRNSPLMMPNGTGPPQGIPQSPQSSMVPDGVMTPGMMPGGRSSTPSGSVGFHNGQPPPPSRVPSLPPNSSVDAMKNSPSAAVNGMNGGRGSLSRPSSVGGGGGMPPGGPGGGPPGGPMLNGGVDPNAPPDYQQQSSNNNNNNSQNNANNNNNASTPGGLLNTSSTSNPPSNNPPSNNPQQPNTPGGAGGGGGGGNPSSNKPPPPPFQSQSSIQGPPGPPSTAVPGGPPGPEPQFHGAESEIAKIKANMMAESKHFESSKEDTFFS